VRDRNFADQSNPTKQIQLVWNSIMFPSTTDTLTILLPKKTNKQCSTVCGLRTLFLNLMVVLYNILNQLLIANMLTVMLCLHCFY